MHKKISAIILTSLALLTSCGSPATKTPDISAPHNIAQSGENNWVLENEFVANAIKILKKEGIEIQNGVYLSKFNSSFEAYHIRTTDENITITAYFSEGKIRNVFLVKKESENVSIASDIVTGLISKINSGAEDAEQINARSVGTLSLSDVFSFDFAKSPKTENGLGLSAQSCTVPQELLDARNFAQREVEIANRNLNIALGAYSVALATLSACVGGPVACGFALTGAVIAGANLGTAQDNLTLANDKLASAQASIDRWKAAQNKCNWT